MGRGVSRKFRVICIYIYMCVCVCDSICPYVVGNQPKPVALNFEYGQTLQKKKGELTHRVVKTKNLLFHNQPLLATVLITLTNRRKWIITVLYFVHDNSPNS